MKNAVGWSTSLPILLVVTSQTLHLGKEKDPPDARWTSLASWVVCWSFVMFVVGELLVMLEPDEMERLSSKHVPLLVLTSQGSKLYMLELGMFPGRDSIYLGTQSNSEQRCHPLGHSQSWCLAPHMNEKKSVLLQ